MRQIRRKIIINILRALKQAKKYNIHISEQQYKDFKNGDTNFLFTEDQRLQIEWSINKKKSN